MKKLISLISVLLLVTGCATTKPESNIPVTLDDASVFDYYAQPSDVTTVSVLRCIYKYMWFPADGTGEAAALRVTEAALSSLQVKHPIYGTLYPNEVLDCESPTWKNISTLLNTKISDRQKENPAK